MEAIDSAQEPSITPMHHNISPNEVAEKLHHMIGQSSAVKEGESALIQRILMGNVSVDDLIPDEVDGDSGEIRDGDDNNEEEENDAKEDNDEASHWELSRSALIDCLAQKDFDTLAERCIKALHKRKYVADACKFLAFLFEEIGDKERFVTFSILSQNVRRKKKGDVDEWLTLATQCVEINKLEEAILCLSKALKIRKKDPHIFRNRAGIFMQLGKNKNAISDYCQALEYYEQTEEREVVNTFKILSKIYYTSGEVEMARDCVLSIFQGYAHLVTSVEVNWLLDLYLQDGFYDESLKLLSEYCDVRFSYSDQPNKLVEFSSSTNLVKCIMDPSLSIDLRVKVIQCLVNLDYYDIIGDNLNPLYELAVDDVGDLYLELIQTFNGAEKYAGSEALLKRLTDSHQYSHRIDILMRYGECLQYVNKEKEAIAIYQRVIDLDPNNSLARLTLSSLRSSHGELESARHLIMSHHLTISEIPVTNHKLLLLLNKCTIMSESPQSSHFVEEADKLLNLFFTNVPSNTLFVPTQSECKASAKIAQKQVFCEPLIGDVISEQNISLITSVWEIFYKVCKNLGEQRNFDTLFHYTYYGIHCGFFMEIQDLMLNTHILCAMASWYKGYYRFALDVLKKLIFEHLNEPLVFNLLNIVGHRLKETYNNKDVYRKVLTRLVIANPNNHYFLMEESHRSLESKVYKKALVGYMSAFRQYPHNPLYALLVSVVYSNVGTGSFIANRHAITTQALAFLNHYFRMRGECQESYYNLGRAMTHWGLNYLATFYYKKALNFAPTVPQCDLKHEIAMNLSKIYEKSGNSLLAHYYMREYCVI